MFFLYLLNVLYAISVLQLSLWKARYTNSIGDYSIAVATCLLRLYFMYFYFLLQINVQASNQMEDKKGLLWILDEEVLIQGSTDDNVINRLCSYYEIKGEDKQGEEKKSFSKTLDICNVLQAHLTMLGYMMNNPILLASTGQLYNSIPFFFYCIRTCITVFGLQKKKKKREKYTEIYTFSEHKDEIRCDRALNK